jgi:hypothetical protein
MFDAGQQPVLYGDVEEKYANLLAGRETLQTTTKYLKKITLYLLDKNFTISCLRRCLPRGEPVGHAFPGCGRAGHPAQARPIRDRSRWEAKQVFRPISDRDEADNKLFNN